MTHRPFDAWWLDVCGSVSASVENADSSGDDKLTLGLPTGRVPAYLVTLERHPDSLDCAAADLLREVHCVAWDGHDGPHIPIARSALARAGFWRVTHMETCPT